MLPGKGHKSLILFNFLELHDSSINRSFAMLCACANKYIALTNQNRSKLASLYQVEYYSTKEVLDMPYSWQVTPCRKSGFMG